IDVPVAELAAAKAAQFYNVEHFEATDMRGGLDDDHLYFKTRAARRQNPDYLGEYLPAAKKCGLRVIVYFDVHWYKVSFGERHPDWVQRLEDGSMLTGLYNNGTSFCVNSPWREWVFQVVRDLCAYPIDGIFFDGPIFTADTCYCQYCRNKFHQNYGREIPSKKIHRGREFHDLVEFQALSIRDFLHDSRRVIKGVSPELAFYINGGGRQANWSSARLNRYLVAEQDLLGFEGGILRGDLSRNDIWKPSVAAKLLETQARGKPRVVFCSSKQSPWPFSILPEPETRLMYAQTVANGANVWMGVMPPDMKLPEMQAVVEMNRFIARNGQYYLNTRAEATIALVWSDATADCYGAGPGQAGDPNVEFQGLADALDSARTPFDVIDDMALEREDLSPYKLIVLPNIACMSSRTAGRLREYAERGGSLLATLETSLYDETGVRRPDFALGDVLGVTGARKIRGPKRWDLVKPVTSGGLLEHLVREVMPSPIYFVPVATRGSRPVLMFMEPLKGPYQGMPKISVNPALLTNGYGSGKAVYASGDLGSTLHNYHMAEYLQIVENAVRQLGSPLITVENGPRSMEISLRSQERGRRLLLHLINFTGEMVRPIRRVMPLEDIRVTLRLAGPVSRIFTLVNPRELRPIHGEGQLQVVLPRIDEYEVIVLER
ncbi:MAG: beta-galactosidase trimerization domain-containing protein, partial [Terriglobia bacterium]